ncbi:MAG: hypothetical protein R3C61_25095 [Bacteroidia bacterium]
MKLFFRALVLLISIGCFSNKTFGQFQCQDTVFDYYLNNRILILEGDTIFIGSIRKERKCLDEKTFVEISYYHGDTVYLTIDTFMVRGGNWFKKFEGKFNVFFSEEKFMKKEITKNCYYIEDVFGVWEGRDLMVCKQLSPISIQDHGVYVFEVYDPFWRTSQILHFDPRVGVIKEGHWVIK